MQLTLNNAYVDKVPSWQNAIDVFEGLWASHVPLDGVSSGAIPLFEDHRISWVIKQRHGLAGANILELGPLEGGHTYMMERAGAASITAVEANSLAFLRCLVVKELLSLKVSSFLLGDFDKFLGERSRRFDMILASGVLYHLADPLATLQNMVWASDDIFIWSHFFDERAMPPGDPRRASFTGEVPQRELGGDAMTYHVRSYGSGDLPKAFCGGVMSGSIWIEKAETIAFFERHGYMVTTNFEHDDHPNGPAACLYARKA